jgi:hypothetical protein
MWGWTWLQPHTRPLILRTYVLSLSLSGALPYTSIILCDVLQNFMFCELGSHLRTHNPIIVTYQGHKGVVNLLDISLGGYKVQESGWKW